MSKPDKEKKKLFGARLTVNTIDNFTSYCESNGLIQSFVIEKLIINYLQNPDRKTLGK